MAGMMREMNGNIVGVHVSKLELNFSYLFLEISQVKANQFSCIQNL